MRPPPAAKSVPRASANGPSGAGIASAIVRPVVRFTRKSRRSTLATSVRSSPSSHAIVVGRPGRRRRIDRVVGVRSGKTAIASDALRTRSVACRGDQEREEGRGKREEGSFGVRRTSVRSSASRFQSQSSSKLSVDRMIASHRWSALTAAWAIVPASASVGCVSRNRRTFGMLVVWPLVIPMRCSHGWNPSRSIRTVYSFSPKPPRRAGSRLSWTAPSMRTVASRGSPSTTRRPVRSMRCFPQW